MTGQKEQESCRDSGRLARDLKHSQLLCRWASDARFCLPELPYLNVKCRLTRRVIDTDDNRRPLVQWTDLRNLPARVCSASRKAYLLNHASQFELMVSEVLVDHSHVLQPKNNSKSAQTAACW
jgi:hypothetical protein